MRFRVVGVEPGLTAQNLEVGSTGSLSFDLSDLPALDTITTNVLLLLVLRHIGRSDVPLSSLRVLASGRRVELGFSAASQRLKSNSRVMISVDVGFGSSQLAETNSLAEQTPPKPAMDNDLLPIGNESTVRGLAGKKRPATPVFESTDSDVQNPDSGDVEEGNSTRVRLDSSARIVLKESDVGCLYGWGQWTNGRLGISNPPVEENLWAPEMIRMPSAPPKIVACGGTHSVVVDVSDRVWFFGRYFSPAQQGVMAIARGEQAVNETHPSGSTFVLPSRSGQAFSPQQLTIPSFMSISAVSCGTHHTLLLSDIGRVWSFGAGGVGQLGLGDWHARKQPTPVTDLNPFTISNIAAGGHHSVCASASLGIVWTFGKGLNGQLGIAPEGCAVDSCRPRIVTGQLEGLKVAEVAAGGSTTCVIAGENRQLFYWGSNFSTTPSRVDKFDDLPVRLLACGGSNIAAVVGRGDLYVWEAGGEVRRVPLRGSAASNTRQTDEPLFIRSVHCGAGHTFVVLASGTVLGMSLYGGGQPGRGIVDALQNRQAQEFVPLSLLPEVEMLSVGLSHCLAISSGRRGVLGDIECLLDQPALDCCDIVFVSLLDHEETLWHRMLIESLPDGFKYGLFHIGAESSSIVSCPVELSESLDEDDDKACLAQKRINLEFSTSAIRWLLRYCLQDSHEGNSWLPPLALTSEILRIGNDLKLDCLVNAANVAIARDCAIRGEIEQRDALFREWKRVNFLSTVEQQDLRAEHIRKERRSSPSVTFGQQIEAPGVNLVGRPDAVDMARIQDSKRRAAVSKLAESLFASSSSSSSTTVPVSKRRKTSPLLSKHHDQSLIANIYRAVQSCPNIIVDVGNESIPVHKVILCARSRYFNALLSFHPLEDSIRVPQCDPDAMQCVVEWLYTGSCTFYPMLIPALLQLSSELSIEPLSAALQNCLIEQLNVENAMALHSLAVMYSMEVLRCSSEDFMMRRLKAFARQNDANEAFQSLKPKLRRARQIWLNIKG